MPIDQVQLNFNPTTLQILNIVIGFVMFGVALDLRIADFKRVFFPDKNEVTSGIRGPLIGLFAQFILLPAFTFLLTLIINPQPSIALGMILVAACPGGNLSNFLTHLAKGNTALSVSMTAVSTAAAIVMTPLNIAIWGGLHPTAKVLLRQVSLDPIEVFYTVLVILGIPLILGMSIAYKFPNLAAKLRKPFRFSSITFFIAFVLLAFRANFNYFLGYVHMIALVVLLHNAMAFTMSYSLGRLSGLTRRDVRAVTIEVGIQNSALGLILIFNFFDGLGGMAVVCAGWGIWHIVSGLTLAFIWSRIPLEPTKGN